MMPYFQDITLQVISRREKAVLGHEAGIAHEQEGDLVVGDFQDYRVLIEVVTCKMCCWWRQNLDLNGRIEINRLASFGGAERNVLAIYQVQVVLEGLRRMRLAAVQDLPHPEIVEDSQQAAYVIIVRVGGHHEIQA